MGVLKTKVPLRLKGFVLLESIFAMIIIMICFGICMVIFNQVMSSSFGALQVTARVQLQVVAEQCKSNREFLDGTVSFEEFTIEKSFLREEESPLTEMKLTAVNPEGKIIGKYHELIIP